jgi:hypothetical protein
VKRGKLLTAETEQSQERFCCLESAIVRVNDDDDDDDNNDNNLMVF